MLVTPRQRRWLSVVATFALLAGCGDSDPDENNNGNGNNNNSAAVCGNSLQEAQEDCDGTDLAGQTCQGLGYAGGNLSCTGGCEFYTADCSTVAECGNSIQEVGESCDGTDLGGIRCSHLGYSSGTLACTTGCEFDTSGCIGGSTCGNGVRETGESCDGTDMPVSDCQGLGYDGGELTCDAACQVDISGCYDCADATPFQGPLCGPASAPCELAVMEVLPEAAASRSGIPDIGLDGDCRPQVLFNKQSGAYPGGYALRTGADAWTVETTPFNLMRGAVAVAADATAYALVDTGIGNVVLYSRTTAWQPGQPLAGGHNAWSDSLVLQSDGTPESLTVGTAAGALTHTLWTPGMVASTPWSAGEVASRTVVARTPSDGLQAIYWQSSAGSWLLRWTADDTVTETVDDFGTTLGNGASLVDLAVGPADTDNPSGRPHLVVRRDDVAGGGIHWVTRDDVDTWTDQTIAEASNATAEWCNTAPTTTGQTCAEDHHDLLPLGIVASGSGQVRVIFVDIHTVRALTGDCSGACFWAVTTDNTTAELGVGWYEGAGPGDDDRFSLGALVPTGGRVVLDAGGRIHVVLFAAAAGASGTTVHYLRLDPTP